MAVYEIEELALGEKDTGDRIVFRSIGDMEQAYKDIDNGKHIYVRTDDGLITKLLNQTITSKIYDGSIKLSARSKKGEQIGET